MPFTYKLSKRLSLIKAWLADAMTLKPSLLPILVTALLACEKPVSRSITEPGAPATSEPPRPGFYVTPTGSASGDGGMSRPWDLTTALAGAGGRVQPGDTIWLRGGTYPGVFTGNLNGTAAKPIVVRQYPGERATLLNNGGVYTNTLGIQGSYTWYWGFEAIGGSVSQGYVVRIGGTSNRVINVVAHDNLGLGVAMFNEAVGGELYGSIVYNFGPSPANASGWGYGYNYFTYLNNTNGPKTVRDNIMFNTTYYGLHAYSGNPGEMENVTFEGNAVWNSGLVVAPGAEIILLGNAHNITYRNNYTYATRPASAYAATFNGNGIGNVSITDNIFHGATKIGHLDVQVGPMKTVTVTGNTFHTTGPSSAGDLLETPNAMIGWTWGNNTHFRSATATAWRHAGRDYTFAGWKAASGLGATDANPATTPSGIQVFVRPNQYEPGRANIIIYNWANAPTVNVDLSQIIGVGRAYTIVNAQSFYGAPVASGVYAGGTVSLPMAGIQSPAPRYASYNRPVTGPTFQVFVVRPAGS